MPTVTSKDGTTIAFDQSGSGPALILVPGMFEQRAYAETSTAQLADCAPLAEHFTVYHYDRRGRGGSTDTLPYAVQREIEDIEALIEHAGGAAYLSGISSGAALALEAALALGGKVRALALYEPPYNDDPDARAAWVQFRQRVDEALAQGRHGDAVAEFIMLTGAPPEAVNELRQYPMWALWEGIAPTVAYDAAAVGAEAAVPADRAAALAVPTLVLTGSDTFPFMPVSADTLASAIPNAQRRTLQGQTHEVQPEALAPVLIDFFAG